MKLEMFEEKVRPLVLKLVEVSSASEEEIPGVRNRGYAPHYDHWQQSY